MELGSHIHVHIGRRLIHAAEFCLLLASVGVLLLSAAPFKVSAAPLGARVLTINDSLPGVMTRHRFDITINTATSVGSIEFEYCTNNPLSGLPCTPPAGLDLLTASLFSQIGEVGFSIDASTTSNRLVLSRVASVTVPGVSTYQFDDVTNPTTPNETTFVRLSTFASTDGTGPRTDIGGVAFAVVQPLSINAYVPPFLILCVGITVAANCTTATGTGLNLGVLSSAFTAGGTSQFGIATNDPLGYQAYGVGSTMTAGNNIIPAMAAQAPSAIGSSQFGVNLRLNTAPAVGQDPTGIGTGVLNTLYDDVNLYRFQSGDLLSSSALSTDFNTYTVAYIVNVNPAQAPGRYATTMTIIGIAAF